MRTGFIFDHNKCVSCQSCVAACLIENKWSVPARKVYSTDQRLVPFDPVINISLACNHCESAVCMSGCPASAFKRDMETGAIIIDDEKCMGCKYCQWNCPYDAPKNGLAQRTIVKCHLCYSRLQENVQPACSSACPTGALGFGALTGNSEKPYAWFPDKRLGPAIGFSSENCSKPLRVIPNDFLQDNDQESTSINKNITSETSLIIFSFLAVLSVSFYISSFLKGAFPDIIFIPLAIVAGVASLFHLGKKKRAWRALSNIKMSPLSREITAYILFLVVSSVSAVLRIPALVIAGSLIGLLFLVIIDSVYRFADRRIYLMLHSGQTFTSALLIISFLSGYVVPFIFIGVAKLLPAFYVLYTRRNYFSIRFLSITFLIISSLAMILNENYSDSPVILIFLAGLLLDRVLYYLDFDPVNIISSISAYTNKLYNEAKRN